MSETLSVTCPSCSHPLSVQIATPYIPSTFTPAAFAPEVFGATTVTAVTDLTPPPVIPALYGVSVGSALADFDSRQTRFGQMNLRSLFHPWGSLVTADMSSDKAAGRTPIVNVKMENLCAAIAAGNYDTAISTMVQQARAYGAPIWVRWGGEMDRRPDLAVNFIAAWRRIYLAFLGDTNVTHLWSPVMAGLLSGRAQPFYPGDDVVDFIAPDGYNVASGASRSFELICKPMIDFAALHHKPCAVPETACRSGDGDAARAAWIDGMAAYIKATPAIRGVAYFDVYDAAANTDWRLPVGSLSEAAFARAVRGTA